MAKRLGQKVSNSVIDKANTEEKPLDEELVFFFVAYKDLDRQRSHGFAPTRIPFLDIVKYARLYGCSQDVEDDLIFYVTGIDDHHIENLSKEMERNSKKSK